MLPLILRKPLQNKFVRGYPSLDWTCANPKIYLPVIVLLFVWWFQLLISLDSCYSPKIGPELKICNSWCFKCVNFVCFCCYKNRDSLITFTAMFTNVIEKNHSLKLRRLFWKFLWVGMFSSVSYLSSQV